MAFDQSAKSVGFVTENIMVRGVLCEPECVEIPTDAFGMNPDLMGEECRGARFAYVMPTFQNPTGLTISVERRKKLAEISERYQYQRLWFLSWKCHLMGRGIPCILYNPLWYACIYIRRRRKTFFFYVSGGPKGRAR